MILQTPLIHVFPFEKGVVTSIPPYDAAVLNSDDVVALVRDPEAVRRAAADDVVVRRGAWAGGGDDVEKFLRWVVADLGRCSSVVVEHAEFGMYGSGYASYVDVFLSWRDGSGRVMEGERTEIRGFALALCRLAPVAALFGDVGISRSANGSSSRYLPTLELVRDNPVPGWEKACREVTGVLDRHGITVLDSTVLHTPVDPTISVETNLAAPPYTVFDAWFHWMD
ncbi:hypothetical protein SacglDRAFT_03011 [Saccharomonospora glauca K62]|uniref:Uncharacterized protein n=1 Tax=Saccharomonospora glauca K62 TaxID=928724 RepID=I1D4K5_9PSEU|nr:hypothetical protein SacglDRAFT_03011 [Saccharomonospora glauca K62]